MGQGVGLSRASVAGQSENRGLSDEVHGGGVLVQVRENWSERLARVQFLRRRWILRVHIDHEVGVCGKECHLTFRIATIGAVRIGLDEFTHSGAIRGFAGGGGSLLSNELVSLGLNDGSGFEKRFDAISAVFTADPGVFESSP